MYRHPATGNAQQAPALPQAEVRAKWCPSQTFQLTQRPAEPAAAIGQVLPGLQCKSLSDISALLLVILGSDSILYTTIKEGIGKDKRILKIIFLILLKIRFDFKLYNVV